MLHKEKQVSIGGIMILLVVVLNVIIIKEAFIRDESWYLALLFTVPLLAWLHEHELVNSKEREGARNN